jgi:hypothetical protein
MTVKPGKNLAYTYRSNLSIVIPTVLILEQPVSDLVLA